MARKEQPQQKQGKREKGIKEKKNPKNWGEGKRHSGGIYTKRWGGM